MSSDKLNTSIFKGYDIRGIFPQDIDADLAYKIGQSYVAVASPEGKVVVGRDVRIHSEELHDRLVEGITDCGVGVIDVGLISTDMLYFAVGRLGAAGGVQVTASHNPPEWHGFKMVKKGPTPMTLESGIGDIRDKILAGNMPGKGTKGKVEKKEVWDEYCDFLLSWINVKDIKPFKIAINPNFGLSGPIFRRIVERGSLPLEIVAINEEPNGQFPKGRPDPFVPENRTEFLELARSAKVDLGITWDADGDRVFFCDNNGEFIDPYYLNTILIKQMLDKNPGEKVIYDPRYTWALVEAIEASGGEPVLTRVGHSYIKEAMIEKNVLFATESSGHTYYRDYWNSDCGMLPPLQMLEYLSKNSSRLSEVVEPIMNKYFISGEINSEVEDKEGKIQKIEEAYKDASISRLDGISVEYDDWRFTVRPSNTESLLRMTLEAKSKPLMEAKRDEVLALIRSR